MIIVIVLMVAFPIYLYAVACASNLPTDAAEADLYTTVKNRDVYGM